MFSVRRLTAAGVARGGWEDDVEHEEDAGRFPNEQGGQQGVIPEEVRGLPRGPTKNWSAGGDQSDKTRTQVRHFHKPFAFGEASARGRHRRARRRPQARRRSVVRKSREKVERKTAVEC